MRGRAVASHLKSVVQQAQERHTRLGREVAEAERRLDDLNGEEVEAFTNLAELYLPELGEDAHVLQSRLPAMRDRITSIVWEKRREIEEIEGSLAANRAARAESDAELEAVTEKIEGKAEERDACREKVEAELETIPGYAELLKETTQANERAVQAKRRLEAAAEERDDKLPAYENDRLFHYLLERKYDTPQYRGRFLAARLDGWVARKVNFREQARNYGLLSEVVDVMQKEVEKADVYLERKGQELLAIEKEVEDRHGFTKIMEEGEALYAERVEIVERIEGLDEAYQALVARRKELESSRGDYYRKAIEEYRAFLQSQRMEALQALARSTTTRSDDGLMQRIERLGEEADEHEKVAQQLERQQDEAAKQLRDVSQVDTWFREADYDASNSTFRSNFDLDGLIRSLFSSAYSAEAAFSLIRESQRFQQPRNYSRSAGSLADVLETLARASQMGGGMMGGGIGTGRRSRSRRTPSARPGRGFGGFGGRSSRTTGGFG